MWFPRVQDGEEGKQGQCWKMGMFQIGVVALSHVCSCPIGARSGMVPTAERFDSARGTVQSSGVVKPGASRVTSVLQEQQITAYPAQPVLEIA